MNSEYWLIFYKENVLISISDNTPLLSPSLTQEIHSKLIHNHSIGFYNNSIIHCAELPAEHSLPANLQFATLRKGIQLIGSDWYQAAIKASAIVNWDKNHQFCSRCGHKTIHKPGMFERTCQHCSQSYYPRISPSVIVLIERGNELLMARSPHFMPGVYGLIAGFVEPGETAEEAVHREVLEEVGIKINNLQYVASQPWPFPDSLILGYTANYVSGEIVMDKNEIEAAGWYTIDNLPGRPTSAFSMSSKLIDHFIEKQKANVIKE